MGKTTLFCTQNTRTAAQIGVNYTLNDPTGNYTTDPKPYRYH